MTNVNARSVHVMADDSIGGLEREFTLAQRKANVGERVKIVDKSGGVYPSIGDVVTIERVDEYFVYGDRMATCMTPRNYVVLEPTDIVRIDGQRYRLVRRRANVGERVWYAEEKRLATTWPDDLGALPDISGYTYLSTANEYPFSYVLEPLTMSAPSQPPKSTSTPPIDRIMGDIASLAQTVVTLTGRVEALERQAASKNDVTQSDAAAIGDALAKMTGAARRPLTRDEVVEQAKKDVESLLTSRIPNVPVCHSLGYKVTFKPDQFDRVEFVVNRDKRTVAALIITTFSGRTVWAKGIAKCAPDDVFNVHIGRAIALRRALGLDVPTYVKAPKPTEVRVGDVVKIVDPAATNIGYSEFLAKSRVCYVNVIDESYRRFPYSLNVKPKGLGIWSSRSAFEIIDDSRCDDDESVVDA